MGQVVCKAFAAGKCTNAHPCPNGAHVAPAVYDQIKTHQEALRTQEKEKAAAAKSDGSAKAKPKKKPKRE